jgi:hypothetical protein
MPLQPYHASTSDGAYVFFGNDRVSGQPIGPSKVVNTGTFYNDPHAGSMSRLRLLHLLNASLVASGAGAIAPKPGVQNAWFQQGSGIPGLESE